MLSHAAPHRQNHLEGSTPAADCCGCAQALLQKNASHPQTLAQTRCTAVVERIPAIMGVCVCVCVRCVLCALCVCAVGAYISLYICTCHTYRQRQEGIEESDEHEICECELERGQLVLLQQHNLKGSRIASCAALSCCTEVCGLWGGLCWC